MRDSDKKVQMLLKKTFKNVAAFNERVLEQIELVKKYDIRKPERKTGNWFKYDYVKKIWSVKLGYHPYRYNDETVFKFSKRSEVIDFLKNSMSTRDIQTLVADRSVQKITKKTDTTLASTINWSKGICENSDVIPMTSEIIIAMTRVIVDETDRTILLSLYDKKLLFYKKTENPKFSSGANRMRPILEDMDIMMLWPKIGDMSYCYLDNGVFCFDG